MSNIWDRIQAEITVSEEILVRLNLGAGPFHLAGYYNLDRDTGDEAYPLTGVPDGAVDELRASHLLEHFGHREAAHVLKEWVRVLRPGGILKLAVPDMEWMARVIIERREGIPITGYLYGGQTDENDYHKSPWWRDQLEHYLQQAGLVDIQEWEPDCDDCCDLPVSLRLQGRKPLAEEASPTQAGALPQPTRDPGQGPLPWLTQDLATNRYSQSGEDGVLEALFAHIGTENRWCVEVGAHDGTTFSNTKKLIEEVWNAVLIECDVDRFGRLTDGLDSDLGVTGRGVEAPDGIACFTWQQGGRRVYAIRSRVTPDGPTSLDNLLKFTKCPQEPDLVCIDVDGQDYFVWNGLLHHRPRVVLCEFDQNADTHFIPPLGGKGQAGRDAIIRLGVGKDYRPVAQLSVNLLFVRSQAAKRLLADARAAGAKPVPGRVPADASRIAADVRAVMTAPRLGFMDNMFCAMQALVPLGISLERTGGVFWDQGIEKALHLHLTDGTKYLLTLDYDTIFTREDVVTLYETMERHPEADALVPIQIMREGAYVLFQPDGKVERPGPRRIALSQADMAQDVLPITTGHFGLTLFRTEALKRVPKPWLHAQPAPDGSWGEGHVDSDIVFWHRFAEAGCRAFLANRVPIGHLQRVVTWPGAELQPVHQLVSDYQEQGKSQDAWR